MTGRSKVSAGGIRPETTVDVTRTESNARKPPTVVVDASAGRRVLSMNEIRQYRELLYFLTWRDIKVRYKQTVIGAAWAILQPVLTMVVFTIIFGRLINVPSDGLPYPIFSYAALLPWTFFATSVTRSSASLVVDANLISKVYFPRVIVPTAAVSAVSVDFALAFTILLAMMLFYGILPTTAVLTLPFFLMLAFVTALGIGLWLAALNVKYRDVNHAVPFLTQFWLFATPVAYPSSVIPEQWRALYGLNPMAGVVEGFRWALLRQEGGPDALVITSSVLAATVIFTGGLLYFRRVENEFADVV